MQKNRASRLGFFDDDCFIGIERISFIADIIPGVKGFSLRTVVLDINQVSVFEFQKLGIELSYQRKAQNQKGRKPAAHGKIFNNAAIFIAREDNPRVERT